MNEEQNHLPKREAMDSLLAQGDVLLQLDPRLEGVSVPPKFLAQPLLVLRIGLEMPIPIPDLEIDDLGITATLSFDRTPHPVVVPWHAVFGMVTEQGQGLLWTADVPVEILDQMRQASLEEAADVEDGVTAPPAPDPPRLVALDGGRDNSEPLPEAKRGSNPPTLHVVR
jgi:stringent starvation protein B